MFAGTTFAQESDSTEDYVLTSNGTTEGGEVIEIRLKNNTDDDIEISDDIDVVVALVNHDVIWERESLDESKGDVILDGQDTMTIEAGEEKVIAKIAPVQPGSTTWRSHKNADYEMLIEVWVKINGVDHHFEAIEHRIEPKGIAYNLELSVNSVEYTEENFNPSCILSLTNKSEAAVTISGKAIVQGTDNWSNDPGAEREEYELIGGDSITIAPGKTVEVVKIEAGPSGSWRNFYFPQIKPITARFNVNEDEWVSNTAIFGITGSITEEVYTGLILEAKDNEDGTASIRFELKEAIETNGVTYENGEYQNTYHIEKTGPAT
jgi:hypothetical protein